ncbi:hypothetical protein [Burkholderia sp. IDO3]|uniref:hypothetical protein n=1 Tax=Burkholderia sp. IDO3 TaxID=1705310 RepID=UPI0011774850|nr:hypothetical protein [Burkholderia sp. IDO3]
MNNAQVLTHPAFDRAPVLNARRHGPTPRGIPMLRRERFERAYAKQKALKPAPEEQLAECKAALDETVRGILIALQAFRPLTCNEELNCEGAAIRQAAFCLHGALQALKPVNEKLNDERSRN